MTERTNEHPSIESLAAFIDGTLSDSSDVENHLKSCADCVSIVLDAKQIELMSSVGLILPLTDIERSQKRRTLGQWLIASKGNRSCEPHDEQQEGSNAKLQSETSRCYNPPDVPRDVCRGEDSIALEPNSKGGWIHAIAASVGNKIDLDCVNSVADEVAGDSADDWWVLRPGADGGQLYVGNPRRIVNGTTWGLVVVCLPSRQLRGTVLYFSLELAVVQLDSD